MTDPSEPEDLPILIATDYATWRIHEQGGVRYLSIGRFRPAAPGEFVTMIQGRTIELPDGQAAALGAALNPGLDEAMGYGVWLHGNWQWLTSRMATLAREAAADAVERWWNRDLANPPMSDQTLQYLRWWRE